MRIWNDNLDFAATHIDKQLLNLALTEDLTEQFIDITSDALFADGEQIAQGKILSKATAPIILSGLPLIPLLFDAINASATIESTFDDGDSIEPQAIIATLSAPAQVLMKLERTILNFLRHLSGIATLTNQFVQAAHGSSMQILDTRKTTPGLRHLEKYAVSCGGGVNHRMGLYDAMMVKDTHVDAMGGMIPTLQKLSKMSINFPVIIEVQTMAELDLVIELGQEFVTRVLLDNMTDDLLKACVSKAKPYFETEVSGNLDLSRIPQVAQSGVNFASVGMITHAAKHVDLSMKVSIG